MYRFRKGALVVWHGQVVPIIQRWDYRDATLYHINSRKPDRTLVQDLQVTFGQIISEINSYAQFCVGDKVPIGPWDTYVKARWWNCRKGTVTFHLSRVFRGTRRPCCTGCTGVSRRPCQDRGRRVPFRRPCWGLEPILGRVNARERGGVSAYEDEGARATACGPAEAWGVGPLERSPRRALPHFRRPPRPSVHLAGRGAAVHSALPGRAGHIAVTAIHTADTVPGLQHLGAPRAVVEEHARMRGHLVEAALAAMRASERGEIDGPAADETDPAPAQ